MKKLMVYFCLLLGVESMQASYLQIANNTDQDLTVIFKYLGGWNSDPASIKKGESEQIPLSSLETALLIYVSEYAGVLPIGLVDSLKQMKGICI